VMTSHSNYMFNKLSNMVLAKEIAPETISVGLMKLGEKGSYIDENAMHIDEDGIDDDNFSETAEALYTERLKLYEQNPS
jgi:predicted ATPase